MVVVFPVLGYVLYVDGLYNQGQPLITFGNLWFLALLLIFSTTYVTWWVFRKPAPMTKQPFPGTRSVLAFIVAMAIISFVVGIWAPINVWLPFGLLEPFHFTQYAMLFGAGIVAYREGWMDAIPKAHCNTMVMGRNSIRNLFLVVVSAVNSDLLLLGRRAGILYRVVLAGFLLR